jgi:hypothetical protein
MHYIVMKKEKRSKLDFLHLGVKRAFEDPGKDQDQASVKRSKQDEDLKRSIKKKLRHLPRKVSFFDFFFFQPTQKQFFGWLSISSVMSNPVAIRHTWRQEI